MAAILAGGYLLWGSGDGETDSKKSAEVQPVTGTTGGTDWNADPGNSKESPKLTPSSCPSDSSNCVVATGRVIYVEANDPDGDGDAHFVTVSKQSVTMAGITIFDVRADLRPDPLPGVGDLVGGAGPVYPGHAGQMQIQVDEFHGAR